MSMTTGLCPWQRSLGYVLLLHCLTMRILSFQGVRDVINVTELFECRPAINAAFHHCKALSKVNYFTVLLLQDYEI